MPYMSVLTTFLAVLKSANCVSLHPIEILAVPQTLFYTHLLRGMLGAYFREDELLDKTLRLRIPAECCSRSAINKNLQ